MLDDQLQKTEIEPDDWILGSRGAAVTLLEYGDFECPYCAMARPAMEGLVAEYPDAIRLVYRHFPLTTVHPHALMAAEAAEAAGAQGKYWPMHDALFAYQHRLEYHSIRGYAAAIGVDVVRFDHAMRDHTYLPEVRRDFRRGLQDGVSGTPTIFINGRRYDGPRDRAMMLAAIAEMMPQGAIAREAGLV